MKRRTLSFLLTLLLLLSMLPIGAAAAENTEIIYFEDGSCIEITVIENTAARATYNTQGSKYLTYKDADGNVEWKATLTGTFQHDGTTSTCLLASCAVDIYNSNWYSDDIYTSWSGDTATTELVMCLRALGVTITTREYTITLTCDKDGNLS